MHVTNKACSYPVHLFNITCIVPVVCLEWFAVVPGGAPTAPKRVQGCMAFQPMPKGEKYGW